MNYQPMNPLDVDTTRAERIAFASTSRPTADRWTELAVYYLPDPCGRAFLAEIVGKSSRAGEATRRRAVYVGTLDRALGFFDDGDLADAVRLEANDWADRNSFRVQNDIEQLRADEKAQRAGRRADSIGTTATTLTGALDWLYGASATGKPAKVQEDFGVPRRTVAHALDQEGQGQAMSGWAKAFVAALRFFDREAFWAAKGGA